MKVRAVKTRLFREGDDLPAFVRAHIPKLADGSVIAVTSKIVALAEKRIALAGSDEEREKLIRSESTLALATRWVWLTLKDGMVMANAGIDDSNADGKLVLLPKDSYREAAKLRSELMKAYGLSELGVLVTDSRVLPLRAGTIGIALGYAGFRGIRDYRGKRDLFGRVFAFSKLNIADSLAAAAVLCMGEGDEQRPLAVIEEAPAAFRDRVRKDELFIPLADDLYLPFFGKLSLPKKTPESR